MVERKTSDTFRCELESGEDINASYAFFNGFMVSPIFITILCVLFLSTWCCLCKQHCFQGSALGHRKNVRGGTLCCAGCAEK